MELTELKKKHEEYNARLKAKGVPMLTCRMPCCGSTQESRAATPGERWDTLATCPDCGALYMKITTEVELQALITESA